VEPTESKGWIRPLGRTGLTVSAVCAGGAPLGSMPESFGYEVPEEQAISLVESILASPLRFLDTSNGYSNGRSESRIGAGIAWFGGLPDDFLVATKVDARDGDYSGPRVHESVRESTARLGLETLPLVYLHDPEFHDFDALTARGGAVDALVAMRESGVIGHIGVAGGNVHELSRYLDLGVFEVVLVHNRWSLVDRSADVLIHRAVGEGVAVVNAAIYGGGILAQPVGSSTSYGYRPASEATLAAIAAMVRICARWDTDLPTAALLASLRDPLISSTVVGFSKAGRLSSILAARDVDLPDEFWREIDDLMPAPENWLDS
jgi:D-threo-aldose 1-dehydrogenase